MKFYLNGKQITKAAAKEQAGTRFESIIKESKETHADDPYIDNSYMVSGGFLSIEF